MSSKIAFFIEEACKKHGITYTSFNPEKISFCNDAEELKNIYLQLKKIIDKLIEIEQRHKINGLGKLLEDDISELYKIDHDLIKFAKKLEEKND